ncbi:E3 ubiquitin protein ligase [Candidatus Babeliales bacterium]|nr:E3 ubiquitin protein ligase [Candidatus Babeliales bacterium]
MQKRFLLIVALTSCSLVADSPVSFEEKMYEQSHRCSICGSCVSDGSVMVPLGCGHKVCRCCFQNGFETALVCALCAKRARSEEELAALDESQVTPSRWKRFVGGTIIIFGVALSAWAWSSRAHVSE